MRLTILLQSWCLLSRGVRSLLLNHRKFVKRCELNAVTIGNDFPRSAPNDDDVTVAWSLRAASAELLPPNEANFHLKFPMNTHFE